MALNKDENEKKHTEIKIEIICVRDNVLLIEVLLINP